MGDFISVCSGIEAASVAWEPLGKKASLFAEIDKFPSEVLAYHYPETLNIGDMTLIAECIRAGILHPSEVLVGGTPCQSYSLAGKRLGLEDPRGQLTLSWVDILDALDEVRGQGNEAVGLWENVYGVLSDAGNAFGEFLGKLAGEDGPLQPAGKKWSNAGCVFGPKRKIAWRLVDAQFFGVAQRRRRVFLVASAREGFNPAEVLFEFDGVRRDSPPSRQAGQSFTHDVAPCLTSSGRGVERTGDTRGQDPVVAIHRQAVWPADVTCTLNASFGDKQGLEDQHINGGATLFVPVYSSSGAGYWKEGVGPLRAREQDTHEMLHVVHGTQDPCVSETTAFALGRNNGAENAIAYGFSGKDSGCDATLELAPTMRAMNSVDGNQNSGGSVAVAYAFAENSRAELRLEGGDGQRTGTLSAGGGKPGQGVPMITSEMKVRRLMPIECERLQGFPDHKILFTISVTNSSDDSVCYSDPQSTNALVAQRYPKSQNSALPVEERKYPPSAKCAKVNFGTSLQGLNEPVRVSVLIDLEQNLLQLHSVEKLYLSVSFAEKAERSPLLMGNANFAQAVVLMTQIAAKITGPGKEVSAPRELSSVLLKSGGLHVNVFGQDIEGFANDVNEPTSTVKSLLKSITLGAGKNSLNYEQNWKTLSCFVVAAINGFIPEQILTGNSYVLDVTIKHGYTNILYRGKPAPDGARYKALGNSMAVPCMRFIGKRLWGQLTTLSATGSIATSTTGDTTYEQSLPTR